VEGWLGGDSVPVSSTAFARSSFAAHRCFKYDASVTGRQRAVPHLKTFFPYRTFAVPAEADRLPADCSAAAGLDDLVCSSAGGSQSAGQPTSSTGHGGCGAAAASLAAACDVAGSRSLPLLPWFLVGSHNISGSAWGSLRPARDPAPSAGSSSAAAECLVVHSYELSVLALPSFVVDPSDTTDAVLMVPAWALERLTPHSQDGLTGSRSGSAEPVERVAAASSASLACAAATITPASSVGLPPARPLDPESFTDRPLWPRLVSVPIPFALPAQPYPAAVMRRLASGEEVSSKDDQPWRRNGRDALANIETALAATAGPVSSAGAPAPSGGGGFVRASALAGSGTMPESRGTGVHGQSLSGPSGLGGPPRPLNRAADSTAPYPPAARREGHDSAGAARGGGKTGSGSVEGFPRGGSGRGGASGGARSKRGIGTHDPDSPGR